MQCFSFFFLCLIWSGDAAGDEAPDVSGRALCLRNVYLLLASVVCNSPDNWSNTFRSEGQRMKRSFDAVLCWLFHFFKKKNTFPQCVSVGFIMLQERSRSFPCSIIQGSVSHRQSLKFHRKQFGGWVICKARWVHTVVPYLCFTAVASCFSCQQSALSQGFILTWGNFVESYRVTEAQVILSEGCFDTRQLWDKKQENIRVENNF